MEQQYPFITFHQALPSESTLKELASSNEHSLCILDYLMHLATQNDDVELLFVQKSHHMNITVVFISQNLFNQNKNARTISLNTHYFILFKNYRDSQQINCLARQIYPNFSKAFLQSYDDATRNPYGYLYVNMSPDESHADLRLLTNIFAEDITVYKCESGL